MLKRILHFARRGELLRAVQFKLLRRLERNLGIETAQNAIPLALAETRYLFATDNDKLKDEERQRSRTSSMMAEGSTEKSYPLTFEYEDRILRYAYFPARKTSKGLVTIFHGWNSAVHLGPAQAWDEFDILAPWDVFGYRRQGSWFWGDRGDNYVERMIIALIKTYRDQQPDRPFFCYGGSMGGFGALYHGIQARADGMYILCPQVDLAAKVHDYSAEGKRNPYGYLPGDTPDSLPDLIAVAQAQPDLPPLMLIQNQYDSVNFFADHAAKLLRVYDDKHAWYGLRVYPAIGHQAYGASIEEAQYFFSLIIEKNFPRQNPMRQKS